MIPDLLNPFFTEVAAASLDAARGRGWHVVVCDTGDRVDEERGTLEAIASQVDAVVGYMSLAEEEIDRLTRGLPVVLIDREHRSERFSTIRIDGEQGSPPRSVIWPSRGTGGSACSITRAGPSPATGTTGSPPRWTPADSTPTR